MSTTAGGNDTPISVSDMIHASSFALQRALVVRFGIDVGTEAHADAMAYAVEHADRLAAMGNPVGYLYRVGQTSAQRMHRWRRTFPLTAEPVVTHGAFVPELQPALEALRHGHRVAVVLVHGYSFSYAEVADVLGVPESTVRNYVRRGLVALRRAIGEEGTS